MAGITKDEMLFIDAYLKNSGVVYEDVRFEMADHVASVLEDRGGDFMDNFTAYMVSHKAELLQNNKQFAITARTRAWKILGKNLIRPAFIMLFALLTWGFVSLRAAVEPKTAMRILYYALSIITIAMFAHGFFNYVGTKKRYSVSDKLLSSICLFFYWVTIILKPEKLIGNSTGACIYYALVITIITAVYYTYIMLVKKYNLQFIK